MGWEKSKGEKKEREKEGEEEIKREKLYLISKFPGDRTVGFWRSKRQSASLQPEFQAKIKN